MPQADRHRAADDRHAGGDAGHGRGAGVGDHGVPDPPEQQPEADGHRRSAGGARDVRRTGGPEQQRREQRTEVGVDLGELEVDGRAGTALREVVLDLGRVAPRGRVADVGAELVVGPAARVVVEGGGVLGEVGLAQALAGAVGQGGHRVGGHPEQRGDVGRLVALDLGVPEHQLPPLGERGEGGGGRGALEALDGRVAERDARVEGLDLVGGLQPGAGPEPVDLQPAQRGQEVRAERDVGSAAAPQHAEDLDEGVGHEVLDVTGRDELAREPARRLDVALEQHPVGVDVPTADRRDELGVPRQLHARGSAHGRSRTHPAPACRVLATLDLAGRCGDCVARSGENRSGPRHDCGRAPSHRGERDPVGGEP
ncbi:hypothetical protein LN652_19780 [Nocardioides okcheonensis]|nr:hypothetical protein [Nocardioides okcheonensis]UFN44260.1 hypothetical protein LN652_19780 [Nocardioides okcheonensis]